MSHKILFVEDEESVLTIITDALSAEGYDVTTSIDGLAGFELAAKQSFDAIILDVMLPLKSGFDLCRDLRARGIRTPILMLTARGQLVDKILGFKLGADDYLTKPFEIPELLVRLEALLRRASVFTEIENSETFDFGQIRVDLRSAEVRKEGSLVDLSAKEFELLRYFIQNPDKMLSREELLSEVWGYDGNMFTRTVDVHLGLLRRKLEDNPKKPRHLITVRGLGYRFLP